MKISNNQVTTILKMYQRTSLEKREKVGREEEKERLDRLSLSSSAVEINKYTNRYGDVPVMREKLVTELKQKIQSGSYQVLGIDVAEKMLNREMVDLLIDQGEKRV